MRPEALSDQELARATLQGLLDRLAPEASLLTGTADTRSRVPFYSEIFRGRTGYLRVGELTEENIAKAQQALKDWSAKDVGGGGAGPAGYAREQRLRRRGGSGAAFLREGHGNVQPAMRKGAGGFRRPVSRRSRRDGGPAIHRHPGRAGGRRRRRKRPRRSRRAFADMREGAGRGGSNGGPGVRIPRFPAPGRGAAGGGSAGDPAGREGAGRGRA